MQNRLDAAVEAQAASEKQLADVQSVISAELAARPESVKFLPSSKFPPPGSLLTHMAVGSARRGASPSHFREEHIDGTH